MGAGRQAEKKEGCHVDYRQQIRRRKKERKGGRYTERLWLMFCVDCTVYNGDGKERKGGRYRESVVDVLC
jgi:hypothetical protein